jgi:hypothetical protein
VRGVVVSWFKTDDKFHSHPKVKAIPRTVRAEAIGTWTLCGTWSADHEKDGYVPDFMVDDLGGTIPGAEALVEVKLWKRRRGGYQFVNWAEHQPTREQNDARREADRVRKADARKAAASASQQAMSATDTAGQNDDPNPPSRPGPDPTRPPSNQSSVENVTYLNASARRTDDGLSTSGDRPVEITRVVEHVATICNRTIHPLFGWQMVNVILARGTEPKNPTAYVLGSITRDPFGWQQFIDTDGKQVPA